MERKDILVAIIIGIITGAIWGSVLSYLGTFSALGIDNVILPMIVAVPIIFIFGLYLGIWLSNWRHFFISFSRFVVVGFLNAGIDFGIFNILMFVTSKEVGIIISAFKTVSFVAAAVNSYYWNKFWAFEATGNENGGGEFVKFMIITIIGILLNVGVTSLAIFFFEPMFGFSQLSWNNIAAVGGTVINLIWNFIGYRIIVFKREAV